jgi:hypothetical protein
MNRLRVYKPGIASTFTASEAAEIDRLIDLRAAAIVAAGPAK